MTSQGSGQTSACGLVLTGGGARGAYQAGVLKGIGEITGKSPGATPFRIVTGMSAGALNATYIAATAGDYRKSTEELSRFWSSLNTKLVFRTDIAALGKIGFRLATDILFGGLRATKHAKSLLDTRPLRALLGDAIPFAGIRRSLAAGHLDAFSIAATDYQSSDTVSFYMTARDFPPWVRARRRAVATEVGLDHVMASSALPIFFPPVLVDGRYYGDGCLRNNTPVSPAVHLGADRLLIVGVRHGSKHAPAAAPAKPSIGRMLSVVLNAILMDGTEADLERLDRINRTIAAIPVASRSTTPLRHIDFLVIKPSEDLGEYAATQFDHLPDSIRFLVSGLATRSDASELVSYLLFEPEFCAYLVELGRRDALMRRDEIEDFLRRPPGA